MNLLLQVVPRVRHELASLLRSPRAIKPDDRRLITELKDRFTHGPREFRHGRRQYIVDCLYCHAVPGTFETSLMLLQELRSDGGGDSLLNLGGGTGQVAPVLLSLGFTVINLDREVDVPDEINMSADLNVPGDLPIARGQFDIVLCQEVIEHVENPWDLLRKARGALRLGGHLVLTTPNIQSIHSKRRFTKTGYFDWFTPDCFAYHVNALPVWEIELIGSRVGFRQIAVFGNGDYYFSRDARPSISDVLRNNEALVFLLQAI